MNTEHTGFSSTLINKPVGLFIIIILALILNLDSVFAQTAQSGQITLQRISLPRGPGSIEGLGESFEPNLTTGSAQYSIPLVIPNAAGGFKPTLKLTYDSNYGVGPFGLGWSLSVDSIQRKTDKGVPRYQEQDTFICSGEELVQISDGSFFSENCKDYARYRRIGDGWEKTLPSGVKLFLGEQHNSREFKPNGTGFENTFRWLISSSIDLNGNRIEYLYKVLPGSEGVKYLSKIRYGFQNPNSINYHEVLFHYEKSQDPSSSFVSRFRRTIGHRCNLIEVNTIINDITTKIRKYVISYHEPVRVPLLGSFIQTDAKGTILPPLRFRYSSSKLGEAGGNLSEFKNLDIHIPVSLTKNDIAFCDLNSDGLNDICYSVPEGEWRYLLNQGELKFSESRVFKGIPTSLSLRDPKTQLLDINGDGRIDLATTVPNDAGDQIVAFYELTKNNSRLNNPESLGEAFSQPEVIHESKHTFANTCTIDLTTEGVRLFDVDFNKSIDFARILDDSFLIASNHLEHDGSRTWHEEKVPFSDSNFPNNTVSTTMRLVDVNGDRLMDFVDIFERDGFVRITCYYGTGDGQFSKGQILHFFDGEKKSDIAEIPVANLSTFHFADINADGLSDFIHAMPGKVQVWPSRGEDFEERIDWDGPSYRSSASTILIDMNGNGSTDIVCLDPENAEGEQLKVLECFPAGRGNLLSQITNGIGKKVDLEYRPLTEFYLGAISASHPWNHVSPLPVHVISRISRSNSLDLNQDGKIDSEVTNLIYAEPFYDGREKQFCGFAKVTRIEWGDDTEVLQAGTATTVTRRFFHTGHPDGSDNDNNQITDEFNHVAGAEEEPLKGRLLWEEVCGIDAISFNKDFTAVWPKKSGLGDGYDNNGNGKTDEPEELEFAHNRLVYQRKVNKWIVKRLYDNESAPSLNNHPTKESLRVVRDSRLAVEQVQHIEGPNVLNLDDADRDNYKPQIIQKSFKYNDFGDLTEKVEHGIIFPVAKRDSPRIQRIKYAHQGNAIQDWILDRVAQNITINESGNIISGERFYYGDRTNLFESHPLFQPGSRALKIRTEALLIQNSAKGVTSEQEKNNDFWVQRSVEAYDTFGNTSWLLDGEGEVSDPASGHSRKFTYDPLFNTYPVSETIYVAPGKQLEAQASFDIGFGVLTEFVDFSEEVSVIVQDRVAGASVGEERSVKGNKTILGYDSHGRLSTLIRPGDSNEFPTEVYSYLPADPSSDLQYIYDGNGGLKLLEVTDGWNISLGKNNGDVSLSSGLSAVVTQKREYAGNKGTVGSVTFTDGLNRSIAKVNENTNDLNLIIENVVLDSRGNPTQILQPHEQSGWSPKSLARRQKIKRDPIGRIVSVIHPKDNNGLIASTRTLYLPLNERRYDEEDNHLGSKHQGTYTDLVYDGFERLVNVIEHVRLTDEGEESAELILWSTQYDYDLLDNLTKITDSQNNSTYHIYDSLSRRRVINDPDRGVITFDYDLVDNQISKIDARGAKIDVAYDGANRKLTETGSFNGTVDTISFHYDHPKPGLLDNTGKPFKPQNCSGKLAWVEDLVGEEHYSYSARGMVDWDLRNYNREGVNRTYIRSEKYDSQDRRIQQRLLSSDSNPFVILSRYNKRGLVQSHQVKNKPVVEFDYHPNGVVKKTKYANKIIQNTELDHRLRLKSLRIVKPVDETQQDLIHNQYSYDLASNLLRIDDLRPPSIVPFNDPRRNTQAFKLDNSYRLRTASYFTGPPGTEPRTSVSFKYDRIGNRLEKIATGVLPDDDYWKRGLGKTNYASRSNQNGAGRIQAGPHAILSSNQGLKIGYDKSGSATNYNGKVLIRDAWGRITQVSDEGNIVARYRYSFKGNRLQKNTGDLVYYPFAEVRDSKEEGLRNYLINDEKRLACFTESNPFYFHHDHLGSLVLTTNRTSNAAEELTYLPYGTIRSYFHDAAYGFTSHFRFNGNERENETGLHFFQNRFLISSFGTFTSCDPVIATYRHKYLGSPLMQNPYLVSLGNPSRYIDPDGRFPVDTAWDIGCVIYDLGKIAWASATDNPQLISEGKTDLFIDLAAMIIPYVPAGITKVGRTANNISNSPLIDSKTGHEIQRFIGDSKGNIMIEPLGGKTISAGIKGKGGIGESTITTYPNGSAYHRLDPNGHKGGPPHGHAHLEGLGPGRKLNGPSLDVHGNIVPHNSPEAHLPIKQ